MEFFMLWFSDFMFFNGIFLSFVFFIFYLYQCKNRSMTNNLSIFRNYDYNIELSKYKNYFIAVLIGTCCLLFEMPIIKWSFFDNLVVNDYVTIVSSYILLFFVILLMIFFKVLKYDFLYYIENIIIFMLTIFLALLIFKASDFFLIYLLTEALTLCLFIIVNNNYTSIKIAEAGLKYYVTATIAGLFLLIGLAFLYYQFGTLNLIKLNKLLSLYFISEFNQNLIIFSLFAILTTFFFKIGAAPYELWVIEIYSGITLPSFFFLSVFSKYIFFIVLLKLMFSFFFYFYYYLSGFIFFYALFSIFIGTIGAFVYSDIRRVLAYGSIAHTGFILLALSELNFYTFTSFFLYLVVYVILMFFFCVIYLALNNYIMDYVHLYDFSTLSNNSLVLGLLLISIFFSMAGIPPFIGFFAKYFILVSVYTNYLNNLIIILVILLLNTIATYIYLRFVVYLFFSPNYYKNFVYTHSFFYYLLIYILAFVNLIGVFFIVSSIFYRLMMVIYFYSYYL